MSSPFDAVDEAFYWLLRNGTPVARRNEILIDVGVLLRSMFDAYLQSAYTLHDPTKRTERATQYLEFQHVEQHNLQKPSRRQGYPGREVQESPPPKLRSQRRSRAHRRFQAISGGQVIRSSPRGLLAKVPQPEGTSEQSNLKEPS